MSSPLTFRPRSTRTIEFVMMALKEALRALGRPLDIPVSVFEDVWKREDAVVGYRFLEDRKTVRFELKKVGEE